MKPENVTRFRPTRHPKNRLIHSGRARYIHPFGGIASVNGYIDLFRTMIRDPENFAAEKITRNGLPARYLNMAPECYWALTERFSADRYDPENWLEPTAAAEIRYCVCVLTARHHNGFVL